MVLRRLRDHANAGEVGDRIERQISVHRAEDGVGGIRQQNRVTVGRGIGDRFGADQRAGAGAVDDDGLVAEPPCQAVGIEAGLDVDRRSRRQRHNDGDDARRITIVRTRKTARRRDDGERQRA